MYAEAVQGSIHAQILPFEFDYQNPEGSYHTMRQDCYDSEGSQLCFYKVSCASTALLSRTAAQSS